MEVQTTREFGMAFFFFASIVLWFLTIIAAVFYAVRRGVHGTAAGKTTTFGILLLVLAGLPLIGLGFWVEAAERHRRHEASSMEAIARFQQAAARQEQEMESTRAARQQEVNELLRRILAPSIPVPAAPSSLPSTSHPGPIEAPLPPRQPKVPSAEVASAVNSSPLPDWVSNRVSTEGDRKLVVVQSEQFADPAEAERQAMQEATGLVAQDFGRTKKLGFGYSSWTLDPQTARRAAVRRTFTEPIERTAGEHDFTVYRTYMLVELSPSVHNQIEPIWREQVSRGRSMIVVALLALLTALAGVAAGCFRLDDWTGGKHRWALGLGATLLLLAGVGVAGTATTHVVPPAHMHKGGPPAPPHPPGRIVDHKPHVDPRKQERFREAADHMVQAINAADYEGLRQDFDEVMLERFPVENCKEFFSTRISGMYGTIETLEPPRFNSERVAVFVARCERGSLDFTLVLDENSRVAGMLFKPRRELSVFEWGGNRTDCGAPFGRG